MKYIKDFIEVIHYGKEASTPKVLIYSAIYFTPLLVVVWGAFKILESIN